MTPCKLQRDKEEYSLIMLSNPIEDALLDKSRCHFQKVWSPQHQQRFQITKDNSHLHGMNLSLGTFQRLRNQDFDLFGPHPPNL